MNKIYAFIIVFPFIALLFFKGVTFYEYDTKQRYLKDQVDNLAYKVKITGVLTSDEYDDFLDRIGSMAKFESTALNKCTVLKKGVYSGGTVANLTDYHPGEVLKKGDAFMVYIKSSDVANYSRIQNGGVNPDDTQNLYYKAKAAVRVERLD